MCVKAIVYIHDALLLCLLPFRRFTITDPAHFQFLLFLGALEEEQEKETEQLTDKQKHQLKHREVFLSRQIETLPATHIRGKCSVTLLNETESLASYLNQEDAFFYTLVYDPAQKTLLADKGDIRVGSRYQAEVPSTTIEAAGQTDDRVSEELETLVFRPDTGLTDQEIQQYLIVAKYVSAIFLIHY